MKVAYTHDKRQRRVEILDARAYLDDSSTHYGGTCSEYNHPRMTLRTRGSITTVVEIFYQRHSGAGQGIRQWARTDEAWSHCYGGHVRLDYEAQRVDIVDRPHKLSEADAMRVAVARWLAKLDSGRCRRIWEESKDRATQLVRDCVEPCELERHVAALREAGVPVVAVRTDAMNKSTRINLPDDAPEGTLRAEAGLGWKT